MFEDIFQKAFNLDPEPFQELLVKAKDELGDLDEGSLQMPSFTPSTKAPKVPRVKKQKVTTAATQTVAAPTAPTKPKLSAAEFKQKFGSTGIAMPQGAPSQAGVKTNVQIDSGTVPQQAIVNSPTGGLQNKTVHTRPKNIKPAGNGPGLYVSPGQPVQQELALEAAKQNKTPLEHAAHPDGGNVVTGNKIGEQPVQPVFDHKARWYHDNLQVGDRVGSKGWSEEHQRWVPFESEVTELNPNGQKFIHVKPIHKDLRDDPNAPSMPVHYGGVDYFHRKDSTNPHKLERYQYAGEYQNPDATAPPNTNPAKQYSPEEANQHLTHLNELKKVKADSVKKHLSDGDYVEFWMRDPKTNEPVLTRGHAYALPTMQTGVEGGEDGAGAKEKASTNKVTVQTEDGPVAVNLWDIHRFGKEVVGDLHLFGFDKTTGAWKNQGVQQNAQQDEPTSSPAEPPNTYPSQTAQQPFIPQVVGTAEPAQGEEEQEPIVPNLPHTPETSRSQTVMAAGAKFLHEDPDEGVIRFSDPKKPGSMYELPIGEVNEENVKAAMGQTPPAVPSGSFHEEEPELNLKSHWTHTMDPALASSATKMVDQLDKLRQTSMVPFNVLQARHTLLHTNDEVKAARSIRDISKFLSNPS